MASTAVRVALRVRPLTDKEQFSNCTECISFIPQQPQILVGKDHSFTYDYVFHPQTAQKVIYDTSVVPLVEKFVNGFNATILAYGQTGSGKTYSMGTALNEHTESEQQGIIPRFINDLFERLKSKQQQQSDFEYQVLVSFLELYNEDLVDLLNIQQQFSHSRRRTNSGSSTCDISIREDIQGNIYWSGVREESCHSPEELLGYLAKGSLCRTTGSTDMNSVSSRSHAIFSVILKQTLSDETSEEPSSAGSDRRTIVSKFHFVDLAGSERLKRTNAQGDRAREGIAINAGLLALGNVISALGDESRRSTHVPYRDSKLTRLLQDSLGGNSQTLMMACVSPSDSNFVETLSTLKYANRARNIKNRVSINQEFAGSSVEVNQLRAQIARLKMEINAMRNGGADPMQMVGYGNSAEMEGLRQEINKLRARVQTVSDELCQVTSERDTLVMERELGNVPAQDWPKLLDELMQSSQPSAATNDTNTPVQEEPKESLRSLPLISQYLRTIHDLRNELADTQERLAFFQSTKSSMMKAMEIAARNSSQTFSKTTASTGPFLSHRKENIQPKQQASTQRRRINRKRHKNGSLTTRSSVSFRTSRRSKVPGGAGRRHAKTHDHDTEPGDRPQKPAAIVTHDDEDDDIEQWLKETVGSLTMSRSSDIRVEVRESINKARSEIEKGLKVLDDLKTLENEHAAGPAPANEPEHPTYACDILADDELFIKLQSEENNRLFSELEHEILDGFDHLTVPDWQSNSSRPASDNTSDTLVNDGSAGHSRVSSNDTRVSFEEADLTSFCEDNPQLYRMMNQIQSDIQVKEELVAQLEKSEIEYGQMRRKFEQKIYSLREEILALKRERDDAMRQSSYTAQSSSLAQREKQQLLEMRHAYEIKMKSLLSQLSDLRRKYSQTSNAIQSSRNQNESMLRALRVNVESLKVEKRRMVKRMKDEAERVKEQMIAHEREIQQLRRKQSREMEAKRRLEREYRQTQLVLQKRTDESILTNEKLKQLITILKKAVREGGVLDEKLLSKCANLLDVGSALIASSNARISQKRRNKKKSTASVEVRAAKKKMLLDQALFQFIQGKQAILEMKQLMYKRDELAKQKTDILTERSHLLNGEENAIEPLDQAVQQFMDERLETIDAEISYLNARIHALQNDAASEMMEDDHDDDVVMMEMQNAAARAEKRVTFADQVMGITKAPNTSYDDEWMDMDALEEKYTLPADANPDVSHDMAVRLLKSFTLEESEHVMEALVDDIVALRMGEYSRQTTVQQLEKTVQDLRRTLIVMKKTAIETTVESEKKIRRLEDTRRMDTRRLSSSGLSVSSRAMDDTDCDDDSAIDLLVDEHYHQVGTIFDKIYNDGIRGNIMSPTWNEYHSRESVPSSPNLAPQATSPSKTSSPPQSVVGRLSAATPVTGVPVKPSISPLVRRRDSMSSPEQFLQQMMQTNNMIRAPSSPLMKPVDFIRYQADRESSTSSIKSRHLRRSSVQSDNLSWSSHGSHAMSRVSSNGSVKSATVEMPPVAKAANRRRAHSFQQIPTTRRRSLLKELTLGASIRDGEAQAMPHQPSPLQQQFVIPDESLSGRASLIDAFHGLTGRTQSPYTIRVAKPLPYHQQPLSMNGSPNASYELRRSQTPSSGSVFDRLASAQTQASQAKRSASSMNHRYSSSSYDDIRRQWELNASEAN
ncbi:uncharacterized protein BYT42DRAFT_607974 [Radiomyces spectabilis]|uniref:uncharacterized protein n=1 Tax=Radiomyces spectabilis TaxID=64574 RepID=UPI00221E4711|nr:uncharacterized protein BYT42DRAFT_607974 [Radiomyces spectabilis]KAI8369609.1 hypothetical protein BYT42DRAFT_607974 [Radiomyces spectabilis]